MAAASIPIPIRHHFPIHETDASAEQNPQPVTLLELIKAVSDVSGSEQQVIATVTYMLNTGRVQLAGSFRDTPVNMMIGQALLSSS